MMMLNRESHWLTWLYRGKGQIIKVVASFLLSIFLTGVCIANVVGSDTQNFNTTTDGLDFVTVQSSETLEPGVFNLGLFATHAVNSLPYFSGESPQSRTTYNDSITTGEFNLGVGLLKNWDIGISFPAVLHQEVESEGYHGQFEKNGNTEIRINTKYRLWGTNDYGIAAIASTNINRIEDNPYVGKNSNPIFNFELAGDVTIANVALGANVGYRWRQPGQKIAEDVPVEPLDDMVIASGAASFLIPATNFKVIAEVFSSIPAKDASENSDRLRSSAESILGIKYNTTHELALHIGGGTELVRGIASPDWRGYAGLNYTFGPTPEPEKPEKKTVEVQKTNDPFAGPPKPQEKIVVHDILFEFDSDKVVLPGSYSTLDKLAAYLNRPPKYKKLIIEGHTDSIGSEQYNEGLSKRRAQAIKRFLINRHNLDSNKIEAMGYGESRPIADNGNFQGRQLNRRVEFKIYR